MTEVSPVKTRLASASSAASSPTARRSQLSSAGCRMRRVASAISSRSTSPFPVKATSAPWRSTSASATAGERPERDGETEEEVAGVHAVGRDDARRVEPASVLALGVEADQLGRTGEEAEDARHLQELLEVEDGVVAAGPQPADQAGTGAHEAREGRDLDREDARHEPALREELLVPGERQEVDLDLGDGGAQRRERRQDHDDVAEPVELDGEDAARPGPGAARRRRRGGAERRQAAPGSPSDRVQTQVD